MLRLLFFLAISAALLAGQITVVQTAHYAATSSSVEQWFFHTAKPHVGDVLLVEGSLNAGNSIKSSPHGWQKTTCAETGSNRNSNPAAAGREQIQIWFKVATAEDEGTTAWAFTFTDPELYAAAVFRELSGVDANVPIDFCYLTAHPYKGATFQTISHAAPSSGDIAIAVIGAYQDKNSGPVRVTGKAFEKLSADERSQGWQLHDALSRPARSTRTVDRAAFHYRAPVSGGVVTGLIWLKKAGTQGVGEQSGIAFSTNTGYKSVVEGRSITLTFNRSVNLSTRGVGKWSCIKNCKSSTYTAPNSIQGGVMRNGVMIVPPDSVFAVQTTNFPADSAHTSTWIPNMHAREPKAAAFFANGGGGAWGEQIVDNDTPTTTHRFAYGCANCSTATRFPNPPVTTRMHEGGAFQHNDGNGTYDTHEAYLNWQSGQVFELYGTHAGNDGTKVGSASTWNVNSADPYFVPGGGAASGMPYEPLLLTLDDVRFGIDHPLEVAFPEFAPKQANDRSADGWGAYGYQWPAGTTNNTGSIPDGITGANGTRNPPDGSLPGLGAWYRLKRTWCDRNLPKLPSMERNLLSAACNYGFILTDWAGGGYFIGHADTDIQEDPAVVRAIAAANQLIVKLWDDADSQRRDFEFIDISSMSPCTPWWNCGQNVRINASASDLVSKPAFVEATASDATGNQKTTLYLPLVRVGVGSLHKFITAVAGSTGLQLAAYVTNSADQKVIWTKDTANSNGAATVSTTGSVTLASTVDTVTFDYFTGKAAADPNAVVHVLVRTIPNNPDGSIRIDSGASACVYKDPAGIKWIGDGCLGYRLQLPRVSSGSVLPGDANDRKIWSTVLEAGQAQGDIDYTDFYAGKGAHYKVTLMMNPAGTPVSASVFKANRREDAHEPTPVAVNGSFGGWVNANLLGPSGYRFVTPGLATRDGFIDVRIFSTHGPQVGHAASLAGMYLEPDTATAPHWSINSREITDLHAGEQLPLSLMDWYTGATSFIDYGANETYTPIYSGDLARDATWSFTQHGCEGSKIGVKSGIYEAPRRAPAKSCADTVQIGNGKYSATLKLTVRGESDKDVR